MAPGACCQLSEPRAAQYGRTHSLNLNGHHHSLCPPAGIPLFPTLSKLTRRGTRHPTTRFGTRHLPDHEALVELQPL